MNHWLISPEAHEQLERIHSASFNPSAHHLAELSARDTALRFGTSSRLLSRQGNVSRIEVQGILTPRPSLLGLLFSDGGTSYAEIRAAIEQADADPATDQILVSFATPGGTVEGLFETIDSLQSAIKPRRAVASLALSAGYALAASTGKIEAVTKASSFGSVGVVATYLVMPGIVEVTSTQAPNKRPDVTTEAGKEVVRSYLDDVHQLLAETIASGRGTSVARVDADFGRGSVLLAGAAQAVGMIDSIKASATSAGPIPRRRVGEDDESMKARLLEWLTAGGSDLPLAVHVRRMQEARAALDAPPSAHGPDESIPAPPWRGGRDLGDQLADMLGAPGD